MTRLFSSPSFASYNFVIIIYTMYIIFSVSIIYIIVMYVNSMGILTFYVVIYSSSAIMYVCMYIIYFAVCFVSLVFLYYFYGMVVVIYFIVCSSVFLYFMESSFVSYSATRAQIILFVIPAAVVCMVAYPASPRKSKGERIFCRTPACLEKFTRPSEKNDESLSSQFLLLVWVLFPLG